MEEYETIKSIIRLIPVFTIFILTLVLMKMRWPVRLPIVFFLGWLVFFFSVQLFWDYSFEYAPTEEIKRYVGQKDGGPRVGSIMFGWIYVIIMMVLAEAVLFIVRRTSKIINRIKSSKK